MIRKRLEGVAISLVCVDIDIVAGNLCCHPTHFATKVALPLSIGIAIHIIGKPLLGQ
jgi:hypothetical protein